MHLSIGLLCVVEFGRCFQLRQSAVWIRLNKIVIGLMMNLSYRMESGCRVGLRALCDAYTL